MELHWVIIGPIVGLLLLILIIIACCYARRKCEKQRKRPVGREGDEGEEGVVPVERSLRGDELVESASFEDGYNIYRSVPHEDSDNRFRAFENNETKEDEKEPYFMGEVYCNLSMNYVINSNTGTKEDEKEPYFMAINEDYTNVELNNEIYDEDFCNVNKNYLSSGANRNTGTKQPTLKHLKCDTNACKISFLLSKTSILGRFCFSYHLKHFLEYLSLDNSYPAETIFASNQDAIPNYCSIFQNDFANDTLTSIILSNSIERKSGLQPYQSESLNISYYPNGIFVHKLIGGMGGRIALQDIILHIPSEAVEQDTLITLGVVWEKQMFDSSRSGNEDVVLSPIVVCQPSGLQLNRSCTLEIPHCASQPNTSWMMDVKTCHGDLLTTCSYEWNVVPNYRFAMGDRTVVIDVNHFTLYTCVGVTKAPSQAAKRMHLVSFLDTTQTTQNTVKERVYCLNDYSVDLKVATEREISFGARPKVSDSTQLLVYDTGKDVVVEVDNLNGKWAVIGSCFERLPFALVWEAYTPHCTLVFEGATLPGMKSEKLVCDILAYQDGNDNNVGKLKVVENVFRALPESAVLIQSQRNQVAEILKEMLDPINECATNAGDWQALAEKMGCSYVRIKWLETQTGSPTAVLIHQWFAEGKTLGEMIQKLEEINRPDAVKELKNLATQNDWKIQELHLNENMDEWDVH
ncbi:UNC5C-like protein [Mya arenaria]|uniref:UNC5C-like protein n=1 Tax=Mya arenaria TaxID=6604 RepID=UPI0022E136B6|nr:UNC5C-like protein [Mya arenaria]